MTEKDKLPRPWWLLPPGRVNGWWWVAAGAAFVVVDYVAAAGTEFPTLYLVPVLFAAWYSGKWPAIALAVGVSLFHVGVLILGWHGNNLIVPIIMTAIRVVVVSIMALWFARLAEHERQLHRYVVKLEGLLPICSFCKSIRNEAGDWESLEAFISERSDADFSHGLCPTCLREHYTHQ